ncbi:MAG: response regulator [Elusimicrobiota bacterium]
MVSRTIHVLLIEDDAGDVELAKDVLTEVNPAISLHVAKDGTEGLAFLRREGVYSGSPAPSLVILDLNLPKKDGREVLMEVKGDRNLRHIPVVILTTSDASTDIERCYDIGCSGYVKKPLGVAAYSDALKAIERFWLSAVELP